MVRDDKIVIIGGGLAGLSAAVKIQKSYPNYDLHLFEKSPTLGGRTNSVHYKGKEIDIGQHLHVYDFHSYRRFIREIGLGEKLYTQPTLNAQFRGNSGLKGTITGSILPPPIHLLPSIIRFPFLTKMEKLSSVLPAAKAALSSNKTDNEEISFGTWLKKQGVRESTRNKLWNSIVVPTLNATVDRVSKDMGLMILRRVLLDKDEGRLGYLKSPLVDIGRYAKDYIEDRGGKVETEQGVADIDRSHRGFSLKFASGKITRTNSLISAVPAPELEEMLSESIMQEFSCKFFQLSWNSIANVHLFYDLPVMDRDFFGMMEGIRGWVFNVRWDGSDPGTHICVSISDPGKLYDLPGPDLTETVSDQIETVLPRADSNELVDSLVIKRPRATILVDPGSGSLRPPATTPVESFYLAGDWTDTGWPSTMEGAVKSGINAADALITDRNTS